VVVAGDHGEELLENGRLAHSSSLDEPQMIIGFGRLWWRGLRGSKEPFNVAILFSMPLVCVYCLNVLGVYPMRSARLILFLAPILIVLFVYGLEAIGYCASALVFAATTDRMGEKVQDALGMSVLLLLLPGLWLFNTVSGGSPLFQQQALEDSEQAVRYLSEKVQTGETVYVHASMREQFKLYSRLTPVAASKIVWGNVNAPCCPRGTSLDGGQEMDMAGIETNEKNGSIWFLFTDRPGYWDRLGRHDPEIANRWLAEAGCPHTEAVSFPGVRIDKYECGRSLR